MSWLSIHGYVVDQTDLSVTDVGLRYHAANHERDLFLRWLAVRNGKA